MSEFPERYSCGTPMPKVKPPAKSRAISREKLRAWLEKAIETSMAIAHDETHEVVVREAACGAAAAHSVMLSYLKEGEFDL